MSVSAAGWAVAVMNSGRRAVSGQACHSTAVAERRSPTPIWVLATRILVVGAGAGAAATVWIGITVVDGAEGWLASQAAAPAASSATATSARRDGGKARGQRSFSLMPLKLRSSTRAITDCRASARSRSMPRRSFWRRSGMRRSLAAGGWGAVSTSYRAGACGSLSRWGAIFSLRRSTRSSFSSLPIWLRRQNSPTGPW